MNLLINTAKVTTQSSSGSTCSDGSNVKDVAIVSASFMYQPKASSGSLPLEHRGAEGIPDAVNFLSGSVYDDSTIEDYLKGDECRDIGKGIDIREGKSVNEHFNFNSGGDIDIFGGDTMSLDLGIEKGCSSSEKTENNVLLPEAGTSAHSICVENNADVQKPCIKKRNKKGAYICSYCKVSCYNMGNLNRHQREKHKEKKDYICFKCGKSFYRRAHLKNHFDWKHSKNPKNKCTMCGKRYSCLNVLKIHYEAMHNKNVFHCTRCKKIYSDKLSLEMHVDDKHKKECSHKCSVCGKCFEYASSLRRHFKNKHDKSDSKEHSK